MTIHGAGTKVMTFEIFVEVSVSSGVVVGVTEGVIHGRVCQIWRHISRNQATIAVR
jgi:hypothetical protein